MKFTKKLKKQKGITLIALVITIIVLLILAGVSIAMLTGENGILNKANTAKIKNEHAQVKEAMSLAYSEYQIIVMEKRTSSVEKTETVKLASTKKVTIKGVEENKLAETEEVPKSFMEFVKGKRYVKDNGVVDVEELLGKKLSIGNGTGDTDIYKLEEDESKYVLKYYGKNTSEELIWQVNKEGNSTSTGDEVDWDTILANADPEKIKQESGQKTSELAGLGTDGKPVNMDYWNPSNDGDSYSLSDSIYGGNTYLGGIENGEIKGKIPEYIYDEEEGKFKSVTNIAGLFSEKTELIKTPEIPSNVTNMNNTFYHCLNLIEAPVIPNSVTYMDGTFFGCTSLIEAPEIPDSVEEMNSTFSECTSLIEAPVIPNGVTNMYSTFFRCTSLIEAPEIPDSVEEMNSTFSECTSLVEAPVIPNGVTNMYSTFSGCTSLAKAPEIPNSVTDMEFTFADCSSLTGDLIINANPTNYGHCLSNVATNPGCNLVLSGASTKLQEIYNTKSENSNITIGNQEIIM